MLKFILGFLIGILATVFFLASRQPEDFRIARSITINAPADQIFPQVNDLRKMNTWSPWLKYDPNAKVNFEGPESGVGATQTWSGNKNVGEGRMKITESNPNELIRLDLEFIKPFKANNTGEFTFKEANKQTTVTWSMLGQNKFLSKVMNLFFNMDKMVGGEFEKGLAELKRITENPSPQ